jgi:hypothetical protein
VDWNLQFGGNDFLVGEVSRFSMEFSRNDIEAERELRSRCFDLLQEQAKRSLVADGGVRCLLCDCEWRYQLFNLTVLLDSDV